MRCRSGRGPRWRSSSPWRCSRSCRRSTSIPRSPARSTGSSRCLGIPWTIALAWIVFHLPDELGHPARPDDPVRGLGLAELPAAVPRGLVGHHRGPLDASKTGAIEGGCRCSARTDQSRRRPDGARGAPYTRASSAASSARAARWPSSTSTNASSAPPTTKNPMIARIDAAARPGEQVDPRRRPRARRSRRTSRTCRRTRRTRRTGRAGSGWRTANGSAPACPPAPSPPARPARGSATRVRHEVADDADPA